ncbi:glycosyltransferase family 2 protein [Barnesiella sp. WM24]|uniref:glycosyltransferase family 2 protein n=1 Tax=Barnesiella sp. WM24 TaxID=2558278 RepID=UPI001071BBD9|nr:glycosyltransferase family 2 protein [Barnesiella sp. WM24]TFU92592.1 glycosyltransferase family 2 protein [Barnesiella sp. WM24]
MDVSIIIVNYNTLQMTKECIESIFKWTKDIKIEIILVDNGSNDGSKEHFEKDKRIKYIYNYDNLGFGKANNIGAKEATGKYFFLLNSDTLLLSDTISHFFYFMERNTDIASCGANLISANGEIVTSHGRFPSLMYEFSAIGFSKLYNSIFRNKYARSQTINEGDILHPHYITGADIFIRANIFRELKGFDEGFFMYYEETDLYKRMQNLGLRSILLPEVSIIHKVGGSQKKSCNTNKFKILFASKIRFWAKHHHHFKLKIVRLFSLLQVLSHITIYRANFKEIKKTIFTTPVPTDLHHLH